STYLAHATSGSRLGVAVMAAHRLVGLDAPEPAVRASPRRTQAEYTFALRCGSPVTLHKFVAYHDGADDELESLVVACAATISTARDLGVDELLARQRRWLAAFWAAGDVRVSGQAAVQQAVRWNLFQLAQA